MELKSLINKMETNSCELDKYKILIDDILEENKYNILREYLKDNNIITSNDLKQLSITDYNKLKISIPDIDKVGEEKTDLFIKKLDIIRNSDNSKYKKNIQDNNFNENILFAKNLGKIVTSKNWFIEINYLKYSTGGEYVDIRQIKNDGTRGKGISIKKEFFNDFKRIINSISDFDLVVSDAFNNLFEKDNKENKIESFVQEPLFNVIDEAALIDK